jgi:hypothetical protein
MDFIFEKINISLLHQNLDPPTPLTISSTNTQNNQAWKQTQIFLFFFMKKQTQIIDARCISFSTWLLFSPSPEFEPLSSNAFNL